MNDLYNGVPTEQLLIRRVKHLEGALEIALGTFSDVERKEKHKQVYNWICETLRGDKAPKTIDIVQPQEPKMLEKNI